MAPDIEELIKKVNTLTLDKNRLRHRLAQLTQIGSQSKESVTPNQIVGSSPSSQNNTHSTHIILEGGCNTSKDAESVKKLSNEIHCGSKGPFMTNIAGVECSTSCEEDLLYLNDLYRKRLDEYNEKWDYMQSKCSSLLSELNALQNQFALLREEKLDLEENLKLKNDECDKIKSELQTVALNYETQLSAMSEHLSLITSRINDD